MIELYGAVSPNVSKITIMLEELGEAYELKMVDVVKGEQFSPAFAALNLNSKVPLIVDAPTGGAPVVLAESGAILLYLAEKHQKLLPPDLADRARAYQWLMFQMSAIGPTLAQLRHYKLAASGDNAPALQRFGDEAARLFSVIDTHLGQADFIAGDAYSVADIALMPWVHGVKFYEGVGVDFGLAAGGFANTEAWYQRLMQRPALKRGLDIIDAYIPAAMQALKDAGFWREGA